MTYTNRFIGIDISKSSFDICVLPEISSASFSNDASGIARFLSLVARLENVARVVLEPTGGYERPIVDALLAAHLPVARVNAKQIRQFAAPAANSPRPTGSMPSSLPTMPDAWKPRCSRNFLRRKRPWSIWCHATGNCRT